MSNELKFKSEEDMQKELKKRISEWKEGQGKDGYIEKASGEFDYKGIKYSIKVLRYFNHTNKFIVMTSQRISDCHVVVEYPKETEDLVKLFKEIEECSEFLYHDTLHTWNDKQNVEQQIEECHKLAKGDIDGIPNIIKLANDKIKKIKLTIDKLSTFY